MFDRFPACRQAQLVAKFSIFLLVVLLGSAGGFCDQSAPGTFAEVKVAEQREHGKVTYQYTVTNIGSQPIVAFCVGGNQDIAGPYEFTALPLGWVPDQQGRVTEKAALPAGWEAWVLNGDGGKHFALEWKTAAYEQAVMPGQSFDGFKIEFLQPKDCCLTSHWTAISRDSQMSSGGLSSRACSDTAPACGQ
jgi:hypothetical protein